MARSRGFHMRSPSSLSFSAPGRVRAAARGRGGLEPVPAPLRREYEEARSRRSRWESLWRSCYENALPHHESGGAGRSPAAPFDGTAAHCAAQLAASLLSEIAPSGARWCGLEVSSGVAGAARDALAGVLDEVEALLQEQFARSNCALALHQSLLDLVVAGTGCLLAEEGAAGGVSALRFQAVPLSELSLAPGDDGDIGAVYRRRLFSSGDFARRFPAHAGCVRVSGSSGGPGCPDVPVVEAVRPRVGGGWSYEAFTDEGEAAPSGLLERAALRTRPWMVFRWSRAPGELWGRSPVMQALPEIRVANRVVELSLRNAALSAVGIWQLDDDGVTDARSIVLEPGAILSRAPGSRGLAPLDMGRGFELNQLTLGDLRDRIRASLLADRLAPPPGRRRRTATEVLTDASENARILGAHYGRLASELVTPLSLRVLHLLSLRGLLPPPFSRTGLESGCLPFGVSLRHRAPLAQLQSQRDSANFFVFLERVLALGGSAEQWVDVPAALRHGARLLGVSESFLRSGDVFGSEFGSGIEAGSGDGPETATANAGGSV